MRTNNKIWIKALVLGIIIAFGYSCTDEFSDLNKKPSTYADASANQLFVNVINSTYFNNGYFYYQSSNVRSGAQYTVSTSGASSSASLSSNTYHFDRLYDAYKYCEQIRSMLPEDDKVRKSITHITQGLLGLRAVKEYGDIPYSEAGKARVGGTLFPKYDQTSEILSTINAELKTAVADIESDINGKSFDPDYDYMYQGDATKWAKLGNVIRLEIALTLANKDQALAKQICTEVASSSIGIFDSVDDEYKLDVGKPMSNSANSLPYSGGGDNFTGTINMQIINMMKANGDPRLAIFALPSSLSDKGIKYLENVLQTGENEEVKAQIEALFAIVDTTKKENPVLVKGNVPEWRFIGGSPFVFDESSDEYSALYKTYHYLDWDGDEPSSQSGRLVFSGVNKKIMNPDYNGTTALSEYFEEQNKDEEAGQFVLPVVPYSYMSLLLSQLDYLNIWDNPKGKDYAEWYEEGVEASIRMYDYIAINHKTNPYNWKRTEAELNGAISDYLSSQDVKLTGTGDWEKICLQQYLNCFHLEELGADHVMRTGFPAQNSTIISWAERPDKVARRSAIDRPNAEEDEANWLEAMQRQNFTPGVDDNITLNKERIWYDLQAPDFGKGDINK